MIPLNTHFPAWRAYHVSELVSRYAGSQFFFKGKPDHQKFSPYKLAIKRGSGPTRYRASTRHTPAGYCRTSVPSLQTSSLCDEKMREAFQIYNTEGNNFNNKDGNVKPQNMGGSVANPVCSNLKTFTLYKV